ncbi:MAG: ABC transporter permease [Pseudomonadales bacterium]|nr:ABC transporter permease [Pseudomonadales bacterium]
MQSIPLTSLALTFIPVFGVIGVLYYWNLGYQKALYAVIRMLVQLLLIGYVLIYLFDAERPWPVLAVLLVMVVASSWISLNALEAKSRSLYLNVCFSILLGGGSVLWLVSQLVLTLEPWYLPRYMIPLAGMIFANTMTGISLAAERFQSEFRRDRDYELARNTAYRAAMIPVVNSLFAVGLVSLPGMMTGQILSGVEPIVAARYQIMVMCMIFGSTGISTACFLMLLKNKSDLTQ